MDDDKYSDSEVRDSTVIPNENPIDVRLDYNSNDKEGCKESFYRETVRHETYCREFSRFKKIMVIALIISFVGGNSIGFGYGLGTKLASSYWIPRLSSDKKNLKNFSVNVVSSINDEGNETIVSFSNIIELVEPAIVNIYTVNSTSSGFYTNNRGIHPTGTGTGMLFHETENKYYIVTNAHVVSGASYVYVSIQGSEGIPASPEGKDSANDVAVISIDKTDAYKAGITSVNLISFGDSNQAKVGDVVLAIGNAMGEGNTATNGIISAKDRNIQIDGITFTVIQTNAAINKGNSGGPLLNLSGQVIGMNTAKLKESTVEGMGYSIPSNIVIPIIEEIMRGGRPMIGVYGSESDTNNDVNGAHIAGILPGSPAEKSGIKINDIIIAYNGIEISSWPQLVEAVSSSKVGETVKIDILRNGSDTKTITLTLQEYIETEF